MDGSTSAPVPHGIGVLPGGAPGCVAFVGGVEAPDASAIVKRVVHWRSGTAGELNW